jgi:tryptophan synthase alpha chain
VGFGISTPEQAAEVGRAADGVIVGSAIVRLVERYGASAELLPRVGDFIEALKAPLRSVS